MNIYVLLNNSNILQNIYKCFIQYFDKSSFYLFYIDPPNKYQLFDNDLYDTSLQMINNFKENNKINADDIIINIQKSIYKHKHKNIYYEKLLLSLFYNNNIYLKESNPIEIPIQCNYLVEKCLKDKNLLFENLLIQSIKELENSYWEYLLCGINIYTLIQKILEDQLLNLVYNKILT